MNTPTFGAARPRCTRLTAVGVLSAGLAACGGTTTEVEVNQVTTNNVVQLVQVAWGSQNEEATVDFQDPRLADALEATRRLVGRPVRFYFDVSRMPRPAAPFFNSFFERQVGRIPQSIEALQRDDAVFRYLTERFQELRFAYDGSRRGADAEYDDQSGILTVTLNHPEIPRGAITHAAREGFAAMLERRFRGVPTSDIEDRDLKLYLTWLDGPGERRAPHFATLGFTEIWERARASGDRGTLEAVREHLAQRANILQRTYVQHPEEVSRSGSVFPDAEAAWSRWLTEDFGELTEEQKKRVFRHLFVRRRNPNRNEDPHDRDAFPSLDRYALVERVMRDWMSQDHPAGRDSGRGEELFNQVFCPNSPGRRNFENGYCRGRGDFWSFVSFDDRLQARLVEFVVGSDDLLLTETVMWNLRRHAEPEQLLDIWHALEDSPKHWSVGARVLGDLMNYSRDQGLMRALYDEAVAMWRRQPKLQSGYLYILVAIEYPRSSNSGLVPFERFRQTFGSPIDATTFERYLATGEAAMLRLPPLWPALANGAVAAREVTNHLDDLLEDDEIYSRNGYRRLRIIPDLLASMRDAGDRGALQVMRQYFERRMRRHPSEERTMRAYMTYTR